jgi:hypothetical protein
MPPHSDLSKRLITDGLRPARAKAKHAWTVMICLMILVWGACAVLAILLFELRSAP